MHYQTGMFKKHTYAKIWLVVLCCFFKSAYINMLFFIYLLSAHAWGWPLCYGRLVCRSLYVEHMDSLVTWGWLWRSTQVIIIVSWSKMCFYWQCNRMFDLWSDNLLDGLVSLCTILSYERLWIMFDGQRPKPVLLYIKTFSHCSGGVSPR